MIIKWTKVSPLEFVASGWGMSLSVSWLPEEHRWAVLVDGARCKQRYFTSSAAMDACEEVAGKTLASLNVKAAPRTLDYYRAIAVVRPSGGSEKGAVHAR